MAVFMDYVSEDPDETLQVTDGRGPGHSGNQECGYGVAESTIITSSSSITAKATEGA